MHLSRKLVFSASLVATLAGSLLLREMDAAACGGCFALPSENTEITSERMIVSISQTQSTLYDEIQYSGNPSNFAWVLPITGQVTVGLSSDALFQEIDQLTAVTVSAPPVTCGCPPPNAGFGTGTATSAGAGGSSGGVTVISQTVVGPYQTVQLSSTNPTALTDWLAMNGYNIPADTKPVIAEYVNEGFDFLALKLLPGKGVSSMQPVRVTTPGASPSLPLRMVAVGAGVTVPITFFVVAEGRYTPTNFPSFTLDPSQLVWDFNTESSNYATLRQQAFTAAPTAWQVESATPQLEIQITSDIMNTVMYDPMNSGYADSMGNGAPAAAMADLQTLFDGINMDSLWITRLFGEMPRSALTKDFILGASASQAQVPTQLTAPRYVNCAGCPNGAGVGGGSGTSGVGASGTGASVGAGGSGLGEAPPSGSSTGCAIGGEGAARSPSAAACSGRWPSSLPAGVGRAEPILPVASKRKRRSPRRERRLPRRNRVHPAP